MTREELSKQSLAFLREQAQKQGVKSITKYRKAELVELIASQIEKDNAKKLSEEKKHTTGKKSESNDAPKTEAEPKKQARGRKKTNPKTVLEGSDPGETATKPEVVDKTKNKLQTNPHKNAKSTINILITLPTKNVRTDIRNSVNIKKTTFPRKT